MDPSAFRSGDYITRGALRQEIRVNQLEVVAVIVAALPPHSAVSLRLTDAATFDYRGGSASEF